MENRSFCRNLCNSADYFHVMASASPPLLFCRLTTLIHSHLNWTQHSHWAFTRMGKDGKKTGKMNILCYFQAPNLLSICVKMFAVLRTVYPIQTIILYNIFIPPFLILTPVCPLKVDICLTLSLQFLLEMFIRYQFLWCMASIFSGSEKNIHRVKNFPLTLF